METPLEEYSNRLFASGFYERPKDPRLTPTLDPRLEGMTGRVTRIIEPVEMPKFGENRFLTIRRDPRYTIYHRWENEPQSNIWGFSRGFPNWETPSFVVLDPKSEDGPLPDITTFSGGGLHLSQAALDVIRLFDPDCFTAIEARFRFEDGKLPDQRRYIADITRRVEGIDLDNSVLTYKKGEDGVFLFKVPKARLRADIPSSIHVFRDISYTWMGKLFFSREIVAEFARLNLRGYRFDDVATGRTAVFLG
jgi:hypothetical protein